MGLSVTPEGYIAVGSETNEVFCYYHSLPVPLMSAPFWDPQDAELLDPQGMGAGGRGGCDLPGQFVSSVCWSRRGNLLLAANSIGAVKVLKMV